MRTPMTALVMRDLAFLTFSSSPADVIHIKPPMIRRTIRIMPTKLSIVLIILPMISLMSVVSVVVRY